MVYNFVYYEGILHFIGGKCGAYRRRFFRSSYWGYRQQCVEGCRFPSSLRYGEQDSRGGEEHEECEAAERGYFCSYLKRLKVYRLLFTEIIRERWPVFYRQKGIALW